MGKPILTDPIDPKSFTVIYKGAFHFKNFYQFLHDWIAEEGYVDTCGAGKDLWEAFYWERRTAAGFTDYNIWWRMKKEINPWFRYILNIDFIGLAVAKTDVMHNGKKISAWKGEIDVIVKRHIEFNYNGTWTEDNKFAKFSKEFKKRIYVKEIKYHKLQFQDLSDRLQEAIKEFFGLTTFTKKGEPFHPKKGLGWG